MKARRVVVANADGSSKVHEDGAPPHTATSTTTRGHGKSILWSTQSRPSESYDGVDPTLELKTMLPSAGGTTAVLLSIPPDSAYSDSNFDPAAAGAENAQWFPGLMDCFEPDNPGFHTSPTIDYDVVLDGEVWLELDDGEVHLTAGDVVIQHGTRHAWRNKTEKPATLLAILIGSDRAAES